MDELMHLLDAGHVELRVALVSREDASPRTTIHGHLPIGIASDSRKIVTIFLQNIGCPTQFPGMPRKPFSHNQLVAKTSPRSPVHDTISIYAQ